MALVEISREDLNSSPERQIVLVVATFSDGSTSRGTGTLVGPNDILTAGHVVYSQSKGWMERLELWFAADFNPTTSRLQTTGANIPWTQWTATAWPNQIYASAPAYTSTPQETQFDVALIGIDHPVGNDLGYLQLNEGFNQTGVPIPTTAFGYSSGFSALTRIETTALKYGPSASMYTIPEQLFAGASGGPLLTENQEVIGVVSAGSQEAGTQFADLSLVWPELVEVYHQNDRLLPSWAAPSWNLSISALGQVDFPAQIIEGQTLLFKASDSHYVADRVEIELLGISDNDLIAQPATDIDLVNGAIQFGNEFVGTLTFASDDGPEGTERAQVRATFYDDDSGYQETITVAFDIVDSPRAKSSSSDRFQPDSLQYQAAILIEVAFGEAWISEYLDAGLELIRTHATLERTVAALVASGIIESQAGSTHEEWVGHIYGNISPPLMHLASQETFIGQLNEGLTDRVELLTLASQTLMDWDSLP